MSDLQTIVYVSTASPLFTDAQLENLLVEARDLNLESGVTGVLLYSDGNFMQCFEGAPDAMRLTYDRIRNSRRHKDIMELLNEPITVRAFPDWQMGFAKPTRSELLALSTAQWHSMSEANSLSSSGSLGFALLKSFWKRAQR